MVKCKCGQEFDSIQDFMKHMPPAPDPKAKDYIKQCETRHKHGLVQKRK